MNKTLLEQSATAVAMDLVPSQANASPDQYSMDFITIIETVMMIIEQVLANCPQSDEQMARTLIKPTRLQRMALLRASKENCACCGPLISKRTAEMQQAMLARAENLTEAEALKLVQEARGFDYLLL